MDKILAKHGRGTSGEAVNKPDQTWGEKGPVAKRSSTESDNV